jgi:SAM-dependent methyltransferase
MIDVNAPASPFDSAYFARPGTTKDREAALRYVAVLNQYAPAGGRVLDVGCGPGIVLDCLRADPRWHCDGVDVSEAAVRQASSIAPVVQADAAELPFDDGEFDAILLLDVLEHTESPLSVLREARRVAAGSGVLVASTPNAGSPLRPLLGRRWHGLADPTHVYFFTLFALQHVLRVAGWRPVGRRTFSSAPGPLGWSFEHVRIAGELCVISEAV